MNNKEFIIRLKKILECYSENASSFAGKIGVPRSSISHLLSGRNKPSLEFILKILSAYPEIDLYWLVNGKGNFPIQKNKNRMVNKNSNLKENSIKKEGLSQQGLHDLFSNSSASSSNSSIIEKEIASSQNHLQEKEIERIVIFYKDGSFSNYQNT